MIQEATIPQQKTYPSVISEKIFTWWDYPIFILCTLLSWTAILYFLWHWFSLKDWLHYPILFTVMTLMVFILLFNNQLRWFLMPFMRRPRPLAARPDWKVGVVTTFVPDVEPIEMLEKTVKALVDLDYPHDTWVLDEGDDAQVKALCTKLGARHFSRKHFPHYRTEEGIFQVNSKHGNYNAWLYEIGFSQYDILATFDPDHIPDRTFLLQVLGYFEDPKVGYVQVPQAYYNQEASFIARGAAEETYGYYSSTQMASYGLGSLRPDKIPDYCEMPQIIGCHNTHRVAALKQVGGFAPHHADDLLITIFYWISGWRGIYVPQILARGLTPVDWDSYLTQQRRWARSILDIKFRVYPKLEKGVALRRHLINFLHGFNYLHKSLVIFASLLLLAFMLATGSTPRVLSFSFFPKLVLLGATLQLCAFYRQRFYLDWRHEWGWHWRAGLLQFAKWPYVLFALYDVIRGRRVPYVITKKIPRRLQSQRRLWPHRIMMICLGVAWSIGMAAGHMLTPFLHFSTAFIVAGILGLLCTE